MPRPKEASRSSRHRKSSAKHDRHSPADSDSFTAQHSVSSTSIEDDSLSSRRPRANANQLEDSFTRQIEQLNSAQTALIQAQQNMESMRHRIRSSGGFEPDSLLYLSDGAGNDLLANVMGYLTVDEMARSEMVCWTMRKSAGRCWEEIHRESHSGARTSEESRYTFRESVIRKHLANTFDSEKFDEEVLDADAIYEARPTHSSRVVREMPPELTHPTSQADTGTKPTYCSCTETYTWHLELASVLLFVLGSVLYLVCSINDYQWSQTLLDVPEWLRGMDDDAVWMRYRLEEQYGYVLENDYNLRKLGGVRRRRRPLSSAVESSDDYDIGYRFNYRRAAEKRINISLIPSQTRPKRGASGRRRQMQLLELTAPVGSSRDIAGEKQDYRKLQSTTPEELYYNLIWDGSIMATDDPSNDSEDTSKNLIKSPSAQPTGASSMTTLLSPTLASSTSLSLTQIPTPSPTSVSNSPSSHLVPTSSLMRIPYYPPPYEPSLASSMQSEIRSLKDSWPGKDRGWNTSSKSGKGSKSETNGGTMRGNNKEKSSKSWKGGKLAKSAKSLKNNKTKRPTGRPTSRPTKDPKSERPIHGIFNPTVPSNRPTPRPTTRTPKPVLTSRPTNKPTVRPTFQTLKPAATSRPSNLTTSPIISTPPTSSPKPTQLNLTSVAPDEAYADEWWRDLPPDIQNAYATLGWNETMWDTGINPPSENMTWSELSEDMQEAAMYLGYTQQTWDGHEGGSTIEDNLPANNGVSSTPSASPIISVTPAPDEMYADEWWKDLPPDIQNAYATLGWNETMWNSGINPPSENMTWTELSEAMQDAATYLGYSQQTWDEENATGDSTSDNNNTFLSGPSASPVSIPMEPAPTTPDEIYADEWWRDLPPDIQGAYAVLGWNETTWDSGSNPPSENMTWSELSPEMQEAASYLGYTQATWDVQGVVAEESLLVQNSTSTDSSNYYDDYDWAELPPDVQAAARILGYDQSTWDSGGAAWSDEYFWDDLPPEAQEAAAVMGYTKISWDADGDEDLEALLVAAGGSYVSNDDDYVFEVGASNIPVSEYQILYFFSALCFLIVGMLDLARERAPYHMFMILAGLLGVVSSVYVEENLGLSNILDTLSVHLYLLEGVTLLVNNVKRDLTDEEMWYKRLVIFADLEFIGGAVLDVMLSYFYLLDDTSDWDTGLAITWVFSAVLWLHCALIYLGLFVYDSIEEKKEIVEEVADSDSLASVSI